MWIILSLIFVFILYVIWKYWALVIGAGYDPTPMKTVRRMLQMAEVGKDDVVYDLGCGDGRIILTAAREFGARAVGIEVDPIRFFFARLRIFFSKERDKVTIRCGNFMNEYIGDATCITLFLFTRGNELLLPKLKKELSPGTRVVSYIWKFKEWMPIKTNVSEDIYVYIIPKPGELNTIDI